MDLPVRTALRWCGSLALGMVIVYVLSLGGLYAFGWFDERTSRDRQTHMVELLSGVERIRLKDELGLDQRRARPAPPAPEPVLLPRQVSGFVQLELEIGTEGEVLDAKVLGAVPEGYFESQALEAARARRYEPAPIGSYRQSEVIPFNITVEPPAGDDQD